ncbi:HesA/MoeB/ThiF family protein [Marivirga sp.]|uniref:HesA/MoeB/ThiF family protein n=1 Tax=Marivirga sp. TaxID=2018662 RepID=UPI002D80AC1D|nr:HesA/MoeB/ThiF family protein [Marivirga sp.]HET8860929.1 HesA/MoeB/ThiF family protein [Marivirga sp.]
MSRFDRQIVLKGFGQKAQQKLQSSSVLVVGAGGLGCPALQYLAAAGVGRIGIIDGDLVSESNLNRQILFGESDTGLKKAEIAAKKLNAQYSDLKVDIYPEFLTTQNAIETIENYDIVLDGSDNFGTRYMLNDACQLLKKPLVLGAIYQYEGQLMVLMEGEHQVNYRDLYPDPPAANEIPNCNESGVLGVLPGIIGTMQAAEVIMILSGLGSRLSGQVLFYDLRNYNSFKMNIEKQAVLSNKTPKSIQEFKQWEYEINCHLVNEISWGKALTISKASNSILIDLREEEEAPKLSGHEYLKMPLSVINIECEEIASAENIILFCQSGARSSNFASKLTSNSGKNIYSIKGGILSEESPVNKENHG